LAGREKSAKRGTHVRATRRDDGDYLDDDAGESPDEIDPRRA
jgi:hypothetical protein